jgi:hypothetical protein
VLPDIFLNRVVVVIGGVDGVEKAENTLSGLIERARVVHSD